MLMYERTSKERKKERKKERVPTAREGESTRGGLPLSLGEFGVSSEKILNFLALLRAF